MQFLRLIFDLVLCWAIICDKWCLAMIRQERALVNLRHSRIVTSPLKSGSNSTELLVHDYTKPQTCLVTLQAVDSWILIDIGYVISGLSQIRLIANHEIEDSHEFLTDIEVELAEYLPSSVIHNFDPFKQSHFTRCDSTGTVSKHTSQAVVDCVAPFNARWVLLKKRGQLNLCFVQILQNTVKPECFHRLSPEEPFFQKAKEMLSAFRSNNYVRLLNCLEYCDLEQQCEAVAFISRGDGSGMCQLLRSKASTDDLLCDHSCELRINRCHIGKRIRIKSFDREKIMAFTTPQNNSYALSSSINGVVSCHKDNCGILSLFISGANGIIRHCGTIDPGRYRILLNVVFMCEQPVKAPEYLILKSNSKEEIGVFELSSINIRVAKEGQLLNYILSTTISSTLTHIPSTSTHIPSTSTHIPSTSIKITSTRTVISEKPFSTITTNTPNTMTLTSGSFISDTTDPRKQVETISTRDTVKNVETQTTKHYDSKKDFTVYNDDKLTYTIKQNIKPLKVDMKIPSTAITKVTVGQILKNEITEERKTTLLILKEAILETKSSRLPLTIFLNQSFTAQSTENKTFLLEREILERKDAPFLWLILLIFGSILVLVTLIVVMITFVEGKRKRKHWDIPDGGLCPPDKGSESITMASSLQISIIR